jgi:hypothetical protein
VYPSADGGPKAKPSPDASAKPKRVSARIASKKAKPIASAASKKQRLYVNQDVVTTVGGKRVHAQITGLKRNEVEVDYYWPADNETYNTTVDRHTVKGLPGYDVEEKVFVSDEGKWHRGEIEGYRRKDNTYLVFWRENNKPWKKYARQRDMRKIK